jgi:hypothetical protein
MHFKKSAEGTETLRMHRGEREIARYRDPHAGRYRTNLPQRRAPKISGTMDTVAADLNDNLP